MSQFPPQQGQPQAAGQSGGGSGLSIAALICGIVALLTSFIPCVNFLSLVLALVAIGLGIAGWVSSSGKNQSPTMGIIGVVLGALSFVGFFLSYAILGTVGENFADSIGTSGMNQAAEAIRSQAISQGADADQVQAAMDTFKSEVERVEDRPVGEKLSAMAQALERLERDLNQLDGVDVDAPEVDGSGLGGSGE
ncbi:MAG: hypothetical protein AAGK78_02740 [Planctomycetota bacterium]